MDHYIEDRQEPETHVPEVDGQVGGLDLHGRVDLLGQPLKVQLLGVFLWK